jgi:hypothetical protein
MASGALFAALVGIAVSRRPVLAFAGVILALLVSVIADAKSVLMLSPLALATYFFAHRVPIASAFSRRTRTILSLVVAVTLIASYPLTGVAIQFLGIATSGEAGKLAVARLLAIDLTQSPTRFVLGLGPGESVSRFAFLTTPSVRREGSPVAALGLAPGRETTRYHLAATRHGAFEEHSSFLSAQSSILGIVGDYGLAGAVSYVGLLGTIVLQLLRQRRATSAAALAGWVLALPLGFVFDWLEQPPYMLLVACTTGLALTSAPSPTTADDTRSSKPHSSR